jgi:hypothetical protein
MVECVLLTSQQVASFVARGFLRFDGVVPAALNEQFLDEVGRPPQPGDNVRQVYAKLLSGSGIPTVPAGTPLADAYPVSSAITQLLELPLIRGAIESLVGPAPRFDHHFLHVISAGVLRCARCAECFAAHHQDSTIDPRNVRHSDHVLPARRDPRHGRHTFPGTSAHRQRSC